MVGIVVVSHSRALARAAVALAEEMLQGKPVRIAMAAGLGDSDERTFGTDAVQIVAAIRSAEDGQGVVVLMDLGSALLSAELALELLDEQTRAAVLLCPAPLVEGLIVAVVAAAGGASRAEVAAEAVAALAGKQAHLAPAAGHPQPGTGGAVDSNVLIGTFTVTNPHGLHARPGARLAQEVRTLDASVLLRNLTTGSGPAPASSLSKVATLGAQRGHQVEVATSGSQAREALERVLALARRGFDEPAGPGSATWRTATGTGPAPVAAGQLAGAAIPASPGIGLGPVWTMRPPPINVPDAHAEDPAAEWRRLREALAASRREIQRVRAHTACQSSQTAAGIFDAHLLLLDDTDLLGEARTRVESGQAAAAAWAATVARAEAELARLPDPYQRARAADVRAVGDEVLRALLGIATPAAAGRGVLVAADLTPAEAAGLDARHVAAVLLAFGSPTAHSAIIARGKGIPIVVGAGPDVLDLPVGTPVAIDGGSGEVVVDPDQATLARFRERAAALARAETTALAHARAPAVTRDGVEVRIGANIGSLDDARIAAKRGADLAGLVRTEFLFLGRTRPPDVEEQEKAYLALAEVLEGRRLTLRTLDVGGDKPLDYLPLPPEANPFLGLRGLRLSLARPTLLAEQLLAIVRVAHTTPVSLLLPMVSTVTELLTARRMLDAAVAAEGRGTPPGLEVGIMVEVPATALKTAAFTRRVDFLSIGTNDLTQYALAAARDNAAVAGIADPYDPAVLQLIHAVCQHAGDLRVAVCGELAADERAAPLLVGLGVRELSVSPAAVPHTKQAIRGLDTTRAKTLAASALTAASPDEVRALTADPARPGHQPPPPTQPDR